MPVSMDSTCAVEENAEVSDGQRVGLCYLMLKAVDGQSGTVLSSS